MEHSQALGIDLGILDDNLVIFASELVARLDVLHAPVGEVDGVLEDGDAEGVLHHERGLGLDDLLARAIQLDREDEVVEGVAPEDPVGRDVDGDAVRPLDPLADDHGAVGAVHAGFADVSMGTPICIDEEAGRRMNSNSARLFDFLMGEEGLTVEAIGGADADVLLLEVAVVDVVGHVVNGDVLRLRVVVQLDEVRVRSGETRTADNLNKNNSDS